MQLLELLDEKKGAIIEQWIDCALSEYHHDASKFLKSQKDQFANPLGYNTRKSLNDIFNTLIQDVPVSNVAQDIEDFIKMKSIQDAAPSAAVSFIFALKTIVRKACPTDQAAALEKEYLRFEARIDDMALLIFDMYMNSRELLYKVQLNEFKRGTHILTEGATCPSAWMRQNMQQQKDIKPIKSST